MRVASAQHHDTTGLPTPRKGTTMTTENTAPTAVDLAKEVLRCARAVEKAKAKMADAEADLKLAKAEAAKGIETA